jgi:serine/threonine protein kinase
MRQGYHLSTDIWSFGCFLFFLLFGESPFFHKNSIQMQSRIRSAVLELGDRNMSAEMLKLITSLLQKSAEARPTAAAVKADAFWKK